MFLRLPKVVVQPIVVPKPVWQIVPGALVRGMMPDGCAISVRLENVRMSSLMRIIPIADV